MIKYRQPILLPVFKSARQWLGVVLSLFLVFPSQAFQSIPPALPYHSATLKKIPQVLDQKKQAFDKAEIIYPQFDGASKASADLNKQLKSLFITKAEEMVIKVRGLKNAQGLYFLSGDFKVHFNRYNFVAFEMHLYTQYPNQEMLNEQIYHFSYNVVQAKKPSFLEVFEVPDPVAWQNKLKAMVGLAPETKIEVEIDDFYVMPQSIVLDLRYGEETKTMKGTYQDLKIWYYLKPQAAYKFLNGGVPSQPIVKQTTPAAVISENPMVTKPTTQTIIPKPDSLVVKDTVGTYPSKTTSVPVMRRKSHVVHVKETLSKICRKYKVSREDFRRWNGMASTSNKVLADQLYYVAPPIARAKYLAQEKDGILSICKKFDIHLSEFLRWNHLEKGDELLIEQAYFVSPPIQKTLDPSTPHIKETKPEKPIVKRPVITKKRRFIKVRRGNTIGGICLKYKITSDDFRRWNGLSREAKIYVGKRYWISEPVERPAYRAKKDLDIAGVCAYFEIHPTEFLRWNHLGEEDQLLAGKFYWVSPPKDRVLPLDESTTVTPPKIKKEVENPQKPPKAKRRFIKVRRGDTLSEICLRYKITKADFRRWNNLGRNSKIYAGKRYWISPPVK